MTNYLFIKRLAGIALVLFLTITSLASQTSIPDIAVESIDGTAFILSDYSKNNKPTLIIFWATWCKPCVQELNNIAFEYDDWLESASFNLVLVSIDDARSASSVKSIVKGRRWPFIVVTDSNQELKRSMNVTDIPHYLIFKKDGSLHEQHTGYLPGDEEEMLDKLIELNNEK